jgi:hypothetical protein
MYSHTSFKVLVPCLSAWDGSLAVYPRCHIPNRREVVVQKRLVEVQQVPSTEESDDMFPMGKNQENTGKAGHYVNINFRTW